MFWVSVSLLVLVICGKLVPVGPLNTIFINCYLLEQKWVFSKAKKHYCKFNSVLESQCLESLFFFLNFQGSALVFITVACTLLCLAVGQCLTGKGTFIVAVCCENSSMTVQGRTFCFVFYIPFAIAALECMHCIVFLFAIPSFLVNITQDVYQIEG